MIEMSLQKGESRVVSYRCCAAEVSDNKGESDVHRPHIPRDPGGSAMPEDLSRFCCLNQDCPDHGKRGADNLTVRALYGKDKRRRMLYCRTCKTRFSER